MDFFAGIWGDRATLPSVRSHHLPWLWTVQARAAAGAAVSADRALQSVKNQLLARECGSRAATCVFMVWSCVTALRAAYGLECSGPPINAAQLHVSVVLQCAGRVSGSAGDWFMPVW